MQLLSFLKKLKNNFWCRYKIKGHGNQFNKKLLQRNKIRLAIEGNDNCIELPMGWKKSQIEILGNGNQIICGEGCCCHKFRVSIFGDNNRVFIGAHVSGSIVINMGFTCHNKINDACFEIGAGGTFNGISAVMLEPESFIKIGKDCMFSSDIELWASDTHSVINLDGELLNYAKGITIGDHVWVGNNVKIGKGAAIADNSIVGWNSVVMKKFVEPNVAIAGNPAKIVKTEIDWNRLSPYNYLQQK